jgi:hypothetical protein
MPTYKLTWKLISMRFRIYPSVGKEERKINVKNSWIVNLIPHVELTSITRSLTFLIIMKMLPGC